VILGLPGDTRASVERTIEFVTGLDDLDHCYFNVAMPYPGTEMRRRALAGEGGTRPPDEGLLRTPPPGPERRDGGERPRSPTLLALQRRAYRRFWLRPAPRRLQRPTRGALRGRRERLGLPAQLRLPARSKEVAFRSEITAMSEMQSASR
jgi:hypothetical protein